MRMLRWLFGLFAVSLLAGALYFRPDLALRVATGIIAHDVCAKTFVSGFEPQAARTPVIDTASRMRTLIHDSPE